MPIEPVRPSVIKPGSIVDGERDAPALARLVAHQGVAAAELQRGVAVVAHPWGRGREQLLPPDFLAALVADHALDGIEVDHQDHDADARVRLWALVDRLGVLGTGSSDYHGTGKTDHELGVNTTRPEVYDELRKRLGAAV